MSSAIPAVLPSDGTGGYNPYDATGEEQARRARMAEAWKAYKGKLPDPLKAVRGQRDSAKTNRCKPIVAAGVAFLVGEDITCTVDAPDTAGEGNDASDDAAAKPPAKPDTKTVQRQDWLDACLSGQDSPNDLMAQLGEGATNAAVCGHGFVKILPADAASKYPRLVMLDPQNVRMRTLPDDVSTVLAYIVEWNETDPRTGQTVQRRQVTERTDRAARFWTITEYRQTAGLAAWEQIAQITWPHTWSPIHDWKNLPNPCEAWGEPDLEEDLIELNKVLNFVQSNVARIIKFHAHPKTVGKGFDVKQLTTNVDGILGIPTDKGDLFNLEMQSDLSSSLSFAADVRSDMDELSHVPAVALGRISAMPRGNLSGVALELLFQPLLQKTGRKRRLLGPLLRQLCAHLLELGGFGAGITISINWPSILPRDMDTYWQTAVVRNQLGVSKRTILTDGGEDWQQEQDYTAQEDADDLSALAKGQAVPVPPSNADGTPLPSPAASQPFGGGEGGGQPGTPQQSAPPMMHPAAVQARQRAQAAAGKRPTPGGL